MMMYTVGLHVPEDLHPLWNLELKTIISIITYKVSTAVQFFYTNMYVHVYIAMQVDLIQVLVFAVKILNLKHHALNLRLLKTDC